VQVLQDIEAPPTIAPRPPTTVANPHIDRSLGSKETHIQSHNHSPNPICVLAITGCVSSLLLAMASLAMVISTSEPAESHSVRTLLSQFLLQTLISARGQLVLRRLRRESTHLAAAQTSILSSILKQNARTTFGRRNHFAAVLAATGRGPETARASYVASVPLTIHKDYVDDIQRLLDLEDAPAAGLLTVDRVEFLCYSSGTTGKNKLVPVTRWSKVSYTGYTCRSLYSFTILLWV